MGHHALKLSVRERRWIVRGLRQAIRYNLMALREWERSPRQYRQAISQCRRWIGNYQVTLEKFTAADSAQGPDAAAGHFDLRANDREGPTTSATHH